MTPLAYVHIPHGYGHSAGMTDLLRTIAHAAIWSTVGRLIWHAPVVLVVVGFAAASLYLLRVRSARRHNRRSSRP